MVYVIENKICTINFMQYHPSLVNDNHWLRTSVTIDYIESIIQYFISFVVKIRRSSFFYPLFNLKRETIAIQKKVYFMVDAYFT